MFDRIPVPVDGSDHASVALQLGVDVANRTDATLHFLTVLEDQLLGSLTDQTERESRTTDILEDAESTANDGGLNDVVTAVETGSIPREIASYAGENGIDLVVMGTHGRTGFDERLLGSISERVIRTASVPVLTTNRDRSSKS